MQREDTFNGVDEDETERHSWTDMLVTIWRARWTIVVITSLVIAAGLAGSLLLAKYKSQGFFQFGGAIPMRSDKDEESESSPGIALADFKRYAASYVTPERFADFIHDKKLDSMAGIDDLRSIFSSRSGASTLIEPVYSVTKRDVRELLAQSKDVATNVIGLNITYQSSSAEIAQQMVGLLGRYAMDSIIYLIYSDALRFKPEETKTRLTKLDNVIIGHRKELEEYSRRAADLKKIVTRNPGASVPEQSLRQMVTVTEDTARYLLPSTLLMATEVQVSEANEAILNAKRKQLQNALLLEYYERARSILEVTKSGETILRSLEPLKASVFKDKDLQDDLVKEVYNKITVENETAINRYLDKSRFIAGPTLPVHTTARLVRALVISMVAGLLLSLLFVFGRKWWRENQIRLSSKT